MSLLLCPTPSNSSYLTGSKMQGLYKGLQSSPLHYTLLWHTGLFTIPGTHQADSYLRAFAFCLECSAPNSCLTHSLTSPRSLLSCHFLSEASSWPLYLKLQPIPQIHSSLLALFFFLRVYHHLTYQVIYIFIVIWMNMYIFTFFTFCVFSYLPPSRI